MYHQRVQDFVPDPSELSKIKEYRPPAAGLSWINPSIEQKLTLATMRRPWLHWLLTMLFMPLAWRMGLRINYSTENFYAETPNNRFNRNYYGTVGGAALLANLEMAAGAYLSLRTEARHRLVCRNASYRFMLPSTTGLHFRVEPVDGDLESLIQANQPFNADLKVSVYARGKYRGKPGRRIGRGELRFHLWPVTTETPA
ncbi:MAG: DUF4442 domain-containing protein [Paracoccus sp. (in: a-proteobacteria)]